MYNPFTKHPKDCVNETWLQHFKFTLYLSSRLIFTSLIFIVHGIFPFIPIPKWVNLTDSANYLLDENKKRS